MLTPLDSPIFDEDVIAELEQHFDDAVSCCWCDTPATVIAVMRCCGASAPLCAGCRDEKRTRINEMTKRRPIRCAHCGASFPLGTSWGDMVREVTL